MRKTRKAVSILPILKNQRHEKFAQSIASGKTQRQAYYDAYPNSCKWKPETVDSKASSLRKNDKVSIRCDELMRASSSAVVMSSLERKEWLTRVIKDNNESMKNRLKALDTLNKMDGDYTSKLELSGSVNNPFAGMTTEQLLKIVGDA